MTRQIGTVESYHLDRGFGVIRPDGVEEDVSFFAHWKQIFSSQEWPQLQKGMKVEYTPSTHEKGYDSAQNITLPGGGQINEVQMNSAQAAPSQPQGQLFKMPDLAMPVPDMMIPMIPNMQVPSADYSGQINQAQFNSALAVPNQLQGQVLNVPDLAMPVPDVMIPKIQLPPANRVLSDFTVVGEVADYKEDIGCGFIVCAVDLPWPQAFPAGGRLFVAREDLVVAEGSPVTLVPGMEVEFRVFFDETKGVCAACVHAVGGVPLSLKGIRLGVSATGTGSGLDAAPAASAVTGVRKTIEKKTSGPGSVQASLKASIAKMMSGHEHTIPSGLPSGPLPSMQQGHANSAALGQPHFGSPDSAWPSPASLGPPGSEGWVPRPAMGNANAVIGQPRWQTEAEVPADNASSNRDGALGGSLAHAVAQLEQAAAAARIRKGAPVGPKVKQVPCKFFSEGRCNKGFSCEFSHDPEMFRPKSLAEKSASPCSFYERGMCTRGDACPFAHGIQELLAIKEAKSAVKGFGKGFKGAQAFHGKGFGPTFASPTDQGGAQGFNGHNFNFTMPMGAVNGDEMDPLELLVQQQNLDAEGFGR